MKDANIPVVVRPHLLKASAEYRPSQPQPEQVADRALPGSEPSCVGHAASDASVSAEVAAPQIINEEFNTIVEARIINQAASIKDDIECAVEQTGADRARAAGALDDHDEPECAILTIEDERKTDGATIIPLLNVGRLSNEDPLLENLDLSSNRPFPQEQDRDGAGMAAAVSSGNSSNNVARTSAVVDRGGGGGGGMPRGGVALHALVREGDLDKIKQLHATSSKAKW